MNSRNKGKRIAHWFFLLPILCISLNSFADDLDDGLDGDSISSSSDLKLNKNILALKRRAKSAIEREKRGEKGSRSWVCGSGNIIVEKGAGVRSVVNLSDNRGTVAVCGK